MPVLVLGIKITANNVNRQETQRVAPMQSLLGTYMEGQQLNRN